ncbi:MAG: hypothetical protein M1592_02595 [Candidatus Thermoplasmatota archaeon]|nr:hypothetical protein [Candidatus Thermoplasmatota archaeon]
MEVAEFSSKRKAQISSDEIMFNLDDWDLETNFSIMGSSKIIHQFDYALVSLNDRSEIIPIAVLTGTKQERMESIVLLHLRTKDLSLSRKFAISGSTVTPYENFLSGMFSVPVVKAVVLANEDKTVRISYDGVNSKSSMIPESQKSTAKKPDHEEIESEISMKDEITMRHRRDHTMIMHDILSLARTYGDLGITKIIYKCNLNYRSALRAVNELLDNKLIEISDNGGAKQKYKITTEGLSMLEEMRHFTFVHE